MIVYVYPADPYGCGFYRLAFPGRAAREQGHDVRVVMPADREGIGGSVDTRTGRLLPASLTFPPDADVIVLQRVAMTTMGQGIPEMRRRGVAVVVDMDDDLRRIDPNNPAFWGMHQDSGSPLHSAKNALQACLDATLVTVSTPPLLKAYAPHGRGVVLENRVPARYLDVPHRDEATIGWGGSVHSHPTDLNVVGPAVARLVREGVPYWGAGPDYRQHRDDQGLRRALGLAPGEGDVETTGDVGFDDWPAAVATMGVGIAPLADTAFNAAKSWLKPLEYMALGVPWVASPRAEYEKLWRLTGVGRMAKGPGDWYREVGRLVRDRGLRRAQSLVGRAAVVEHGLTYEASAWRWMEAWAHALDLQRGRAGAASKRVTIA